jgi:hypothetical protein
MNTRNFSARGPSVVIAATIAVLVFLVGCRQSGNVTLNSQSDAAAMPVVIVSAQREFDPRDETRTAHAQPETRSRLR